MVFSDPIFLFVFLPVSVAVIASSRGMFHNIAVLSLSLIFYYYSAGYVTLLLIGSVLLNFVTGRMLASTSGPSRRRVLQAGILLNLLILGYFKYAYFVAQSIEFLLPLGGSEVFASIVLPIGGLLPVPWTAS